MPYATLNGIRIHYEVDGSGDPLLLVSGLSAPGANWLFQVRELSPLDVEDTGRVRERLAAVLLVVDGDALAPLLPAVVVEGSEGLEVRKV